MGNSNPRPSASEEEREPLTTTATTATPTVPTPTPTDDDYGAIVFEQVDPVFLQQKDDDDSDDGDDSDGQSKRSSIFMSSFASLGNNLSLGGSIRNSLNFGGQRVSLRDLGGQSTIAKSSFNLIKNLVGAGVLALPSGVASFADSPSAVLPASAWIIVMGAMFAYEFQLIAKTCSIMRSVTFREAWEDTMGHNGGLAVSLVNMLKPALGNLAYSMILADTFRSLFDTIGLEVTRNISLLLVTLVGIVPLCLMKNLDALAPFSILGTAGIFLIAVCMAIRYFDGTYDATQDGQYLKGLPDHLQPAFGTYNGCWTGSVLVFVAMIFEAFVAHYNAPRFIAELQNPTMKRFRFVVGNAFVFSSLIYVIMTAFGFLTFGGNCDGYILNNYATDDPLATVCRVAIAFSILFTYPITFMGFRDGVLDALEIPSEQQTSTNVNIVTFVLLIIVTILAAIFKDLGFINAVGGGTLATAIVFVFPALMFSEAIKKQRQPATEVQKQEVKFAFVLMGLGIIMGLIGVVVELQHE